MTRPVPYYKDLCMICSNQMVDESDCFSAQYLELQNDFQIAKFHGMPQSSQSPVASIASEDEVGDTHTGSKTVVTSQKNKRQLENQSNSAHPKKSRGKEEGMDTAFGKLATAVSSLSDRRKDESSSISIENVIEAIQSLPHMDEDLILDACDFLEDEMKAKTFMALDVKLRKKWLLRKLRPEL